MWLLFGDWEATQQFYLIVVMFFLFVHLLWHWLDARLKAKKEERNKLPD